MLMPVEAASNSKSETAYANLFQMSAEGTQTSM